MNVGLLAVSSAWGGAEPHSVQLARTLARRGHTAAIDSMFDDTDVRYEGHIQGVVPLACLPVPKAWGEMGILGGYACSPVSSGMSVCFKKANWTQVEAGRSISRLAIAWAATW